jgi:hypothetical protein
VNATGDRYVAAVAFDVTDLDAAYAEIDARWRASESPAHAHVVVYQLAYNAALASRDWDALAALHAPTLVARDHRLVGWDVLEGPAAFLRAITTLVDMAPDVRARFDHSRISNRGCIAEVVWAGTRDGGAFESPFLWVVELDADGRGQRFDFYDPHHLDQAFARFEELCAPTSTRSPALATPNAASAAMNRWQAAFHLGLESDDWDAMRAVCAPGMTFEDRRRLALLSGDVDLMIASAHERARMGAKPERWLRGALGARVVIENMLWSGGPADGRFEIEYVGVVEVDAAGLVTAMVMFDLDDLGAAQREAYARWTAIDPAAPAALSLLQDSWEAFGAHDQGRVRAAFADDLIVDDHRRTGAGRIEGADAYTDSLRVFWELAPQQSVESGLVWFAYAPYGGVTFFRRWGTLPDGGAFESEYLALVTSAHGRLARFEYFEVDDLDAALARFAELRPDPLRIPPNTATRTWDRWQAAFAEGDLESTRALYAPDHHFDDRRRLVRTTVDLEGALLTERFLAEGVWRPERTVLATLGDRLVLQRVIWRTGESGAESEIDTLEINEVDRDGRHIRHVLFDPDDRAAASTELFERYAASLDGPGQLAIEAIRAWNTHDLERLRALIPADFYLDDHRRTGVGRLEGVDAYVDSLAAVWELSRDLRIETLYLIAVEPHGTLYVCRWFGTNTEGGEFESVYVCLALVRGDRPIGLEIFELDDLEAARARFEALGERPQPTRCD